MTLSRWVVVLVEMFKFGDYVTELLKLWLGKDSGGDLYVFVIFVTVMSTYLQIWRALGYVTVSVCQRAEPTDNIVAEILLLCINCLVANPLFCCLRPDGNDGNDGRDDPLCKHTTTACLFGLPLVGPIAMALAHPDLLQSKYKICLDNRLTTLQILLEDLPNFFVDMLVIVQSEGEGDVLWYYVSLAWSVLGFAGLTLQCVVALMKEDGTMNDQGTVAQVIGAAG